MPKITQTVNPKVLPSTPSHGSFTESKIKFDQKYINSMIISQSFVTVNGTIKKDIVICNKKGEKLEEYYKWQFIAGLIWSGLYTKDYIGCEINFPKGNKNAASLKIDCCIFDDKNWINHYNRLQSDRSDNVAINFLREHCICVIEFKRGKDDIEQVFQTQLKPAIKESDSSFVFGIIYDEERLYLFHRDAVTNTILRYDESKNLNTKSKGIDSLRMDIPDSYILIPSFTQLTQKVNVSVEIDRADRTINDLDIVENRSSSHIRYSMNSILRSLDKHGLRGQKGYELLIECLALKIFDEKRNQKTNSTKLRFYITDEEFNYEKLHEKQVQGFITRMKALYDEAQSIYPNLLRDEILLWKKDNHIRTMMDIIKNFQDYSFVRSEKSDLYQLVFYNFAQPFQVGDKAQFLTPLRLIDFLVNIVNPRGSERVCDPCVGIADFLSLSYVNSVPKLDDKNLYGVDIDENMIMLSQLNMLLNGDGNATLIHAKDKGSILHKIRNTGSLVPLQTTLHKGGKWDEWSDDTKLMKFDVILTNPPFGRGRSYEIKTQRDRDILSLYETWDLCSDDSKKDKSMDLGILFLENTYRLLNENGRFGIVLSNSIVATKPWKKIMDWLINKVRIVGIFDLPEKVFAETNVNPTLIVGYKPKDDELELLKKQDYTIFVRTVNNVGYEVVTVDRNLVFKPIHLIDPDTFNVVIDKNGSPVINEDFSRYVGEFKQWALTQEETLQKLFLK